eukprot:gnl/TRDRNA2_/TRDRNA2_161194_c2_seq1.p1 gnl/TRDRNA2_/TRDRNA2_161194_c2~~gnl/TRDRNA2_/TRDRNA2_161194_c2_seq1.p1  ORF type:complete len:380 (-),score=82.23 gnl/TRDRNA2_/TRDRNA2_161194_c2_seq1:41-1117(-)
MLALDDLRALMKTHEFHDYMVYFNLTPVMTKHIFLELSGNGSSRVQLHFFLSVAGKMKGAAKSADMLLVLHPLNQLMEKFQHFATSVIVNFDTLGKQSQQQQQVLTGSDPLSVASSPPAAPVEPAVASAVGSQMRTFSRPNGQERLVLDPGVAEELVQAVKTLKEQVACEEAAREEVKAAWAKSEEAFRIAKEEREQIAKGPPCTTEASQATTTQPQENGASQENGSSTAAPGEQPANAPDLPPNTAPNSYWDRSQIKPLPLPIQEPVSAAAPVAKAAGDSAPPAPSGEITARGESREPAGQEPKPNKPSTREQSPPSWLLPSPSKSPRSSPREDNGRISCMSPRMMTCITPRVKEQK